MRTGGTTPPYRIPCGGTVTPNFWLGGPYQHGIGGANVPINIPTVNVSPGSGCGAINGLYPPCEQFSDDTGGGCSARSGIGPYGSWIGGGAYQYSLAAGQVNTAPDSWAPTGTTENFALCRKAGFKMITARRFWHGLRGFLDYDGTQCADTTLTCSDGSTISYRSYQPAPSQVKYLTITRSLTMHWTVGFYGVVPGVHDAQGNTCGCGAQGLAQGSFGQNGSMNLSVTYHVNPLTGVITPGLQTLSYQPTQGGDFGDNISLAEGQTLLFTSGCAASLQAILDNNAASVAAEMAAGPSIASSSGSLTNTSFTANVSSYYPTTLGGALGCAAQVVNVGSDYELSITLSDEYDASNVYQDITTNLLSTWPLNDDLLHPWRTDGCLGAGPLVTRNEKGGNTSPDTSFIGTVNDLRQPIADANGNAPFTSIGITDASGLNPGDPGYTPTSPPGWTYSATNNGTATSDSNGNFPHTTGTWPPATGQTYNPAQGPLCGTAVDWIPTYDPNPVSWIPTYAQITWFDPNAYTWRWQQYEGDGGATYSGLWATDLILLYDGGILGAPKPAGYQDFFCWQCIDWKACSADGVLEYYIYGYGQTAGAYGAATGAQIPLNATQWTDNYFGIGTPPGASVMYSDPTNISVDCGDSTGETLANTGGGLIACKYAEIMENWPSQNFARPGGADAFLYDENNVYCVAGSDGFYALTNANGATPPTLDMSGVWGGPAVGGFYTDCIYSDGALTTVNKVFNVPSDWTSASGDNGSCFGKLRWANYPRLLGRAAITYASTTATFATAQTAFGMAVAGTEQVDIYDATMTLLASNVTATRVNDTSFTTGTGYPTAAWAMIHGAPAYQYCDNYRKGDYLALQWFYDRRTNGEYARLQNVTLCDGTSHPAGPAAAWPPGGPYVQANSGYSSFSQTPGCLPFKTCCPAVICFSPNGETWPNGTTLAFPASFPLDELYGSRWQGYVQTTMTDLFWQPAHQPCGTGGTISSQADDGTCKMNTDSIHYYAYPPQVEARASVPTGFPALPGGIQIGWLDPTVYASGPSVFNPGAYLYVGYNCDGTPASIATPWTLCANLCANLSCYSNAYANQNPPC